MANNSISHSPIQDEFKGFGTLAIHAGQPSDPVSGAVIPAISLSATFAQTSPGVQHAGFEYSRTGNPTRNQYEALVASLEGGKYGIAFSSGSAATNTILAMFSPGDHVITVDDVYGGTNRLFRKLLWIESPTNPTLKVIDIEHAARVAHEHNILVAVDNTFLSPFFQNPLSLGADIVVHSITKYINGHSDVVGGIVVTSNDEIHKKLRFLQNGMGAVPSPFDCFLAMRGIKTLHIRMKEHEKNAIAIAAMLENSDKIEKVLYPGLQSHPQHEVAKKQQRGYGGMITVYLKGGIEQSRQFLENLKLFTLAESLGGVESLAEHPAIMTHASVSPEERAKLGISDNLCRLSIGIEDVNDLIRDLQNALNSIKTSVLIG